MVSSKVTIINAEAEPALFEPGGFYRSRSSGAVYECVMVVGALSDPEHAVLYLAYLGTGTIFRAVHSRAGEFTRFHGRIEIETRT